MSRLKDKNNIAAVIPFYNERRTIKEVVINTLKYVDKIFAVDDGSTDESASEIIDIENVHLIEITKNKGKGFALKRGFESAVLEKFDYVVTLDADLQHNPDEIPALISEIENYDIVIGNRLKNLKDMPPQRKLSNKLTSFLLSVKTGQKILDSQCGFRVYRADVIKNVSTKENGFEAETEILIKSAKAGFKIGFAGVSTIYGDEKSKMRPVKTTIGFIKLLFT